ncbi:CehA/McbA family metallohydrolase [bacterium]|nr:CehA/McbA family metallohydrolase [bacterium]
MIAITGNPDCQTLFMLLGILPFAYAEIHYTLRGFSLVSRRRPEILADAPWRTDPGRPLPVLLFIKDADRYPVQIRSVRAMMEDDSGRRNTIDLIRDPLLVDTAWWQRCLDMTPEFPPGQVLSLSVEFHVTYLKTGRQHTFINDNLWSSTHRPLSVTLARDPLPAFKNWIHGDLHLHSDLTNDQVEYGAPVHASARAAAAMGLRFMAVTDHSYDLDDRTDNYLINDPDLPKWKSLFRTADTAEKESGTVVLTGEEVSCGNYRNENVHLLLLNNSRYVQGAGDSNERWFRNDPDLGITQILDGLDETALAFAAHPGVPFAPLQRVLLKRGIWHERDFDHPGLNGLQIFNGGDARSFRRGKTAWISQLLKGRRSVIIAGNDAHGNFNRNRKLGQPFLYITENAHHTFGRGRTFVQVTPPVTRSSVLEAVRRGRACITTGPVLDLSLSNGNGAVNGTAIGATVGGYSTVLEIRGQSTREFGPLTRCDLWAGRTGGCREHLVKRLSFNDERLSYTDRIAGDAFPWPEGYIRGELFSRSGKTEHFCLTNPVWVKQD